MNINPLDDHSIYPLSVDVTRFKSALRHKMHYGIQMIIRWGDYPQRIPNFIKTDVEAFWVFADVSPTIFFGDVFTISRKPSGIGVSADLLNFRMIFILCLMVKLIWDYQHGSLLFRHAVPTYDLAPLIFFSQVAPTSVQLEPYLFACAWCSQLWRV